MRSPDAASDAGRPIAEGDWFENWFGEDYLAVYPHRDGREADQLISLLRSKLGGREIGRVLDLACGAGRHSRALRKIWWTVGFDLSETLLAIARREAPDACYVRGDMRILPFRSGSFSLVVNLFTSFGYFSDDRDHQQVIAGVAEITAKGGTFVLDYLNADGVVRNLVPYDARTINGVVVEQRRSVTPDGRFVEKCITLRGKKKSFVERVRLFSRPELTAMLEHAGFGIDAVVGDYSGTPWTPEADRTMVLAVRR